MTERTTTLRGRWGQFAALAALTLRETVRRPVFLLVSAATYFFIAALPFLLTQTLGNSGRLVRDSALALHLVIGLLLGATSAGAALRQEIIRGTLAAVLSKPVGRGTLFLAKFAGVAGAMGLFSYGAVLCAIIGARVGAVDFFPEPRAGLALLAAVPLAFAGAGLLNAIWRRPFVSWAFALTLGAITLAFLYAARVDRAGAWTAFAAALPMDVLPAGMLITLAIWALAACAVSLATRLAAAPTLAICAAIFAAGLMSEHFFSRAAEHSRWAAIAYGWLPNWQHFWMSDALAGGGAIPWSYVGLAAGYTLCLIIAILALGALSFQEAEVS